MLASVLIEEVVDIIGHDALASLMRSMGRKLTLDREPQVVDEASVVQHMNQGGQELSPGCIVFIGAGGTSIRETAFNEFAIVTRL